MHETLWGDDRLRTFISALRESTFFAPVDETERDAFERQARIRVVPEVQRRILAEVGAAIDARGTAQVSFAVLEREAWGRRFARLVVTPRPWELVVDLTVREVASAYRADRRKRDRRVLAALAEDAPSDE